MLLRDNDDSGSQSINLLFLHSVPETRFGSTIPIPTYYQTATYYGHTGDEVIFEVDGRPCVTFLNPQATFEARRTVSADAFPRDLLSQLDYAQRAEITPLLETTGEATDSLKELSPEEPEQVTSYLDNKELYIDVPSRSKPFRRDRKPCDPCVDCTAPESRYRRRDPS
jgi:hypothetical protein